MAKFNTNGRNLKSTLVEKVDTNGRNLKSTLVAQVDANGRTQVHSDGKIQH
jgi:hypothetical protein